MPKNTSGIREVTSPANALVKIFRRALADGVTRQGWVAVEGPHPVEEALGASENAVVQSVLVARTGTGKFRALLERLPKGAEVAQVSDRLFERVAQTDAPQGIAALVELRHPDLDQILTRPNPLLLVACGLQDPANLGTLVRSAQALGGTAVLTLQETVSPFNPKALRASAGAIFHLPVFSDLEAGALFPRLRAAGVRILAADRRSPAPLAEADLRGPVAILIGREATGLAPEIAREASQLVAIPIRPQTDSVSAGTAGSLFLYEAARQRGFRS